MPITVEMRDFVVIEVELAAEDSQDPLLTAVEQVHTLLYEISTSLGSRLCSL